jgi:spore coat polysaccharide biosynthesis predicted glycosyltransferase SpsG
MGHVVRSLELASRLQANHLRVAMLPSRSSRVRNLQSERGITVVGKGEQPDLIVVDRPDTSAGRIRHHRRQWPGARVVVLDYYGPVLSDLDVLVNLNRRRVRAPVNRRVRCYREGLRYAILRESFHRRRFDARRKTGPARVYVCFGGTDVRVWSTIALRAIAGAGALIEKIEVVVGRESPELQRAIASVREPQATLHVAVRDPSRLLARCDIAVVGGGTTLMEAACVGVPAIVIPRTKEERVFSRDFVRSGAAVALPDLGRSEGRLRKVVAALAADAAARRRMSAAGRRLIDGRGTNRVLAMITNHLRDDRD